MRLRTTLAVGLVILFGAAAIATTALKARNNQDIKRAEGLQLPIVTNQLPSENGVIPVELKCENAELSAPNAVEKLSCVIKNNTDKPISAGAIYTSIILEKDGLSNVTSSYGTFDTFLHPDFRADHKNNLILPRGEYRYNDLPSSYDNGVVIKSIVVKIDYIEFADSATLGPNQAGSRIIPDARKGAAKYKNWLAQKYKESGGLLEAIVPLFENNQPLPEGLEFQTGPEEHGATMYRNFARRTYKNKGAEGLVKFLRQTKTSANE